MKTFSLTILFVIGFQIANAKFIKIYSEKPKKEVKPACIKKGNFTFSVGYGAPSLIRTFLKYKNEGKQYSVIGYGPYMFKADYMINDKWSVGLNFTYSFSRLSWKDDGWDTTINAKRPYEYGVEAEDVSALVRANYHFFKNKNVDMYAGLGLGYGLIYLGTYTEAPLNQFSVTYNVPKPFALEGTVGARYYITKHIGIYGELGIGKSWILLKNKFIPESIIQAGINIKF